MLLFTLIVIPLQNVFLRDLLFLHCPYAHPLLFCPVHFGFCSGVAKHCLLTLLVVFAVKYILLPICIKERTDDTSMHGRLFLILHPKHDTPRYFTYMPYLTLWDEISQNLGHLEGNSHKKCKSHRIFRPFYSRFYEEINISHTLLWFSQASYTHTQKKKDFRLY